MLNAVFTRAPAEAARPLRQSFPDRPDAPAPLHGSARDVDLPRGRLEEPRCAPRLTSSMTPPRSRGASCSSGSVHDGFAPSGAETDLHPQLSAVSRQLRIGKLNADR